MERLTKRNETDSAYYYPHCFREDTCTGNGYSTKCNECDFSDKICEKLGQYEDAEERGLLLRLPCKAGDTVYRPIPDFYEDYNVLKITKIVIDEDGIFFGTDRFGGLLFEMSSIGKTIFLTEKEAEQALAEMKIN